MKGHITGKQLEGMIEASNRTYDMRDQALVEKNPTPWKVQYKPKTKSNARPQVKNAWPDKKGTVDFEGVSQGLSLAFDAKTTQNKTSFPLQNLHSHQHHYLEKHQKQGGCSFYLIEFAVKGECFFVPVGEITPFLAKASNGGPKSIPYSFFRDSCREVKTQNGVALDYLAHVKAPEGKETSDTRPQAATKRTFKKPKGV